MFGLMVWLRERSARLLSWYDQIEDMSHIIENSYSPAPGKR